MRRLIHGLIGLSLVLTACGDDDGGNGDDLSAVTSVPEETTSSSTTTAEAPTVAPDVIPQDESQITEEYVEQVLDALYEVSLEATVLTREAGFVEEPAIRIVEATSSSDSARNRINSLIEDVRNGFKGYRTELTPVDADVLEVIEASSACIFAEATFDSSGLSDEQGNAADFRIFARLLAATDEQRASGLNPTAWVLDELPATQDGSVPEERCGGR